jgi:hypothetical protein
MACFTPNVISSHWGTIGRLGELISVRNLIKGKCHAMGPLTFDLIYRFDISPSACKEKAQMVRRFPQWFTISGD